MKSTSTSVPQLRGARTFTFEEVKKITNNFSEANDIGNGGYGKVNLLPVVLVRSEPFLS
jgi:hypothetical protein